MSVKWGFSKMNPAKRILLGVLLWAGFASALHMRLNVDWSSFMNDRLPEDRRKLIVAYIPVT